MKATKRMLADKAGIEDLGKLEVEAELLRSQVTGELTGARWLWTTGKLLKEGWVPWDTEVSNALPSSLVWRPNTATVVARPPGLYRLCVSVFTSLPSMLQV